MEFNGTRSKLNSLHLFDCSGNSLLVCNLMAHHCVQEYLPLSQSWATSIYFTSSQPTTLISILILSSHC
jgi:hypothetical protein